MTNNQGALYFGAGIDMNEWRKNITEMRRDILGLSNTTAQQTKQMDTSFRMIGTGLATYFSGAALGNFVNQIINVRGEFQKTEIAFGTMLKSTDKAKALMEQMVELAAKTPFSLQDVSAGAKQLLAFQVPAEQVVDTLTRMGNIAAGLGVPLSRINLVYGQVMAKGKLMGDDLRQFTEAGIPMLAELAKKFGTSTAEISKMVSAGKIGFNDVKDVLFSLTNEGGMFFNLMEKQSKSLSGQIANLGDAWDQMLNKIGESNEGILSDSIAATTYLVENYETVIEVIGVAVASYGAYRAALIATAAWQQLSAGAALQQALAQGTLTTAQAYGAAATVALQRAQIGLNAAMMANPIGVVIGLIAGLTYVIYKNVTATNAYIDLQAKLKEENDKNNSSIDEQKSKIESLTNIIKNKNSTDAQAKSALDQINALTGNRIKGLTVEGIRLGQNTTALQGYIKMLELEARAKSLIATKVEAEKREREIRNDNYNDLSLGDRFGNFRDISDLKLGVTPQQRKRKALIEDLQAVWKTKAEIDRELAKLQAQGVNIGDAIIETATNATSTAVEETKKKARELAEVYSLNSIADLEQRIALWNEALQKASGDTVNELTKNKFGDTVKTGNTVSVNQALDELEKLEKAKAARQKEITRLSFDEELAETERQWKVKYMLAQQYGQKIADEQFPELKGSYYSDIDKRRLELENKLSSGVGLSDEELRQYEKLQQIINSLTGQKDPLSNFNDGIDVALRKLPNLTAQIEYLTNLRDSQTDEGTSQGFYAAADERLNAKLTEQRNIFNQILEDQKSFEERSLALQKEYDAMRALAKTDAQKKAVDQEYSKRATDLFFEEMAKSEEWVKVFTNMNLVATTKLEEFKRILQTKLSEAKTIEEKIKIGEFLNRIDETLIKRNPLKIFSESIINYIQNLKNLKQAQDAYNESVAKYGANSKEAAAALKKLQQVQSDTENSKKEAVSNLSKSAQEVKSYIGDVQGILTDIKGAFDDLGLSLDNGFGDVLDKMEGYLEGMSQQMDGMIMAAEGFVTGNPVKIVAGTIKAVAGLIKSISSIFNNDRKKEREIKKQAAALRELENAYNALGVAAEKALGAQKYSANLDMIKNLEQQKVALEGMIRAEDKKKKTDHDKINDWRQQINGINQTIDELKENIISDVLQTNIKDMASQMGDALVEAFGRGEDGVDAINAAFDNLVKNILKNQLNKALEGQMQGVYKNLLSAAGFNPDGTGSFDGLTEAEIADIRAQYQLVAQNGADLAAAIAAITGSTDAVAQGLTGDIKGITEKTAGALEAQINAIRIYQVEANNIHKANQQTFIASLQNLIQIEFNTRRLHSIDATLAEMNSKMKKQLAGVP